MLTKEKRIKAIRDNKEVILEFLNREWEELTKDDAVYEPDEFHPDGDVRRMVKDFFYKTPEGGMIYIAFEFKINTRSATKEEEVTPIKMKF